MIAPRLKSRSTIPYGGMYYWKDPLTGAEVRGTNWNMLIGRIYAERRANGVPVGLGFEDEVEKDLCRDYPAECEIPDPNFPTNRRLTLSDVIRGSQVMMSFLAHGSPLVDRAEAERRARICLKCPFNTYFSKPCTGICQELANVVASIINHQGTQYDTDLKACNVCGCFLQAAIWMPLDIQCKGVTEEMACKFKTINNCWKICD